MTDPDNIGTSRSSARKVVRREVRVALSRRAQPVWFRILKWVILIVVGVMLWRTRYFWFCLLGALVLSLTLHFMWRWKTKGWTQPWGGWDDVETGDKD
jgi:hypothetical protein